METARLAVAGGSTVRETAARLGVNYEALRKRALRGKWVSPRRVARAAEQRITEHATRITAESRAERGARYEQFLGTAAERFARRAAELDAEELIAKAGGIEKLDRVARRTLGLDADKPDHNQVNLAILGHIDITPATYETSTTEGAHAAGDT